MKILSIILIALFMTGCASGLLNKVPNATFATFVYDRGGNVTSVHIEAKNGIVTDGILTVKDLVVVGSYPFANFRVEMKGYKRTIEDAK